MSDAGWNVSTTRSLMVFLNGQGITEPGRRGEKTVDDSFVLCIHAGAEPRTFTVPDARWGEAWTVEVDTRDWSIDGDRAVPPGAPIELEGRSLVLLRSQSP
jgi:glycogen operon protein